MFELSSLEGGRVVSDESVQLSRDTVRLLVRDSLADTSMRGRSGAGRVGREAHDGTHIVRGHGERQKARSKLRANEGRGRLRAVLGARQIFKKFKNGIGEYKCLSAIEQAQTSTSKIASGQRGQSREVGPSSPFPLPINYISPLLLLPYQLPPTPSLPLTSHTTMTADRTFFVGGNFKASLPPCPLPFPCSS